MRDCYLENDKGEFWAGSCGWVTEYPDRKLMTWSQAAKVSDELYEKGQESEIIEED